MFPKIKRHTIIPWYFPSACAPEGRKERLSFLLPITNSFVILYPKTNAMWCSRWVAKLDHHSLGSAQIPWECAPRCESELRNWKREAGRSWLPFPYVDSCCHQREFCTLNFRTLGENAGPWLRWGEKHPCKHLSFHPQSTRFIHMVPNLLIHTYIPEVILNAGSSPFYRWVCGTWFF